MSRAYIYDNGGLLLVTNDLTLIPQGSKPLWEGSADSPEDALQQFDPKGEWTRGGTGRA